VCGFVHSENVSETFGKVTFVFRIREISKRIEIKE